MQFQNVLQDSKYYKNILLFILCCPLLVFYLSADFFYSQFISNFIRINKSNLEKSLFRISKDSKIPNYFEREMNLLYAKINETPEKIRSLFKNFAYKNQLQSANIFIFQALQQNNFKARFYTKHSKKFNNSLCKIFSALYNANTSSDYKLPNSIKPYFRSYFGQLDLNDVLLSKGQLIKCNILGNNSYFYWNIFQNFIDSGTGFAGIIIFFSETLPSLIVATNNLIKDQITSDGGRYGYSIYNTKKKKFISKTSNFIWNKNIKIPTLFEKNYTLCNNTLYLFYTLDNQHLLIGSIQLPTKYTLLYKLVLASIVIALIILFLQQSCNYNFYNFKFTSIKQKILALFLLTYIIPTLVFLITALQFCFSDYQLSLFDKTSNMHTLIEMIDENFNTALLQLDQIYRKLSKKIIKSLLEEKQINHYVHVLSSKKMLDQAYILDSQGKYIYKYSFKNNEDIIIEKLIPYLSRKALAKHVDYSNPYTSYKSRDYVLDSITENLEKFIKTTGKGKSVLAQLYDQTDKLHEINLGNDTFLLYMSVFQDKNNKPNIIILITKQANFGFMYLTKVLHKYEKHYKYLYLKSNMNYEKYNIIFNKFSKYDPTPKEYSKYNFTRIVHEKLRNKKQLITFDAEIIREPYLIVASSLNNIQNFYLIIAYSTHNLRKKLYKLLIKFIIINLFTFIFTLGVSYGLYLNFIYPLNEINFGLQAIAKKNYNYKTNIKTNDEFEYISKTINSYLEKLHEISVANIVQNNLLPQTDLQFKNYEIAYFYKPYDELGGDYFDFMVLQDRYILFFIGDVTGHGIPAAIIMSMVKAIIYSYLLPYMNYINTKSSIISNNNENKTLENNTTEEIISQIFLIISKIDSLLKTHSKNRLLITMFCGLIDTFSNSLFYKNAGHMYPILFNKYSNNYEILKCPSMPLGVHRIKDHKMNALNLNNYRYIILFTDGLVESVANKNLMSVYEIIIEELRDLKLEKKTFSAKELIEIYINSYFNKYLFHQLISDDITMIVINTNCKSTT